MKGHAWPHAQPKELFFLTFITDTIVNIKVGVSCIIVIHALLVVSVAGSCVDDVIKRLLVVSVDVNNELDFLRRSYRIVNYKIPQLVP